MKEFVTKEGNRVKEGDKLAKVLNTAYGPIVLEVIEINDKSIPELIEEGVLISGTPESTKLNIQTCIEHLAKRIKWNTNNLDKYLENLYKIYPIAVFSILLRELAIILDEKYPNHIENSKEIWCISAVDGEIKKIKDVTKIKNFRNFAAFRTLEDAKIAKEVMKEALSDLFVRGGKQKN